MLSPELTPRQATILAALRAEPGKWSVTTLAEDLEAAVSSIQRTLQFLRDQGLARAIPAPRTGRRGRPAIFWEATSPAK